jgi:glucuronate isomerase
MTFLTPDFLLDTPQARRLYHEVAAGLPIIDYHCHLDPALIASNHQFADLSEIWLGGDHYKWRAMRTNGVAERLITGDAPSRAKFDAWAATVPKLLRNPLYHWTHLELRRPFGISDRLLDPTTAASIWNEANARLATPAFTTRGLLTQMRVEVVCTTDDPADDLAAHRALAADPTLTTRVLPTWRPDRALAIDQPQRWNAYLDRLGAVADVHIATVQDLLTALQRRHDAFHAVGCRLSDHGLEGFPADPADDRTFAAVFAAARAGTAPSPADAERFQARLLHDLALLDHARGWVQQFHIGALRNVNLRQQRLLGADSGYDVIAARDYIAPLAAFLGRLDDQDQLAKTILYNLNPRDNEAMAVLCGAFQDGSVAGKVQFGSGWWFLDQLDGMTRQIEALSQLGLLAHFVGMLTDSRSFLSYTRHEYFRRLLCRILGRDMAGGLLPDDHSLVGGLVHDVSYRNAATYFPWRT